MKKYLKKVALYFAIATFILLYFLFPKSAGEAVSNALALCGGIVIPSLFIFFIISDLFVKSGMCEDMGRLVSPLLSPLLKLSGGACVSFIVSLISGYPAGGIGAVTLYKKGGVGRAECERLLMFSNNCGPAFLITAVGSSMLGSVRAGAFLYIVHIISAALIAALSGRIYPSMREKSTSVPPREEKSALLLLSDAISSSALIMLNVCASIVVFSAVIGILNESGAADIISGILKLFDIPENITRASLGSLLELTAGTSMICSSVTDARLMLTLISAFTGFGGFCVHMQLLPHVYEAGLRAGKYFLGKTAHAVIAAAITYFTADDFLETAVVFSPAYAEKAAAFAFGGSLPLLLCAGAGILSFILFKKRS